MTTKYHISPATGNPNKCYAHKKPCPVGGENDHYPTKEAARQGFEKGHAKDTTKTLKKNPVKNKSFMTDEDKARIDKYVKTRKARDRNFDGDAEQAFRERAIILSETSRGLSDAWGGSKVTFLNEGAITRLPAPNGRGAEVELQVNGEGRVYFRVLDSAHRIGFDPHAKASWAIMNSPTSTTAIKNTVEKYMNDYRREQEEGYARVRAYEASRKQAEATSNSTTVKNTDGIASAGSVKTSLQGPKPEAIRQVRPAEKIASYRCSSCGTVDSNMMRESYDEGFDGYSPCCNKGMESATETLPPTFETKWGSSAAARKFAEVNKINSYVLEERDGKVFLTGRIAALS